LLETIRILVGWPQKCGGIRILTQYNVGTTHLPKNSAIYWHKYKKFFLKKYLTVPEGIIKVRAIG
jgi:hypothetical protein